MDRFVFVRKYFKIRITYKCNSANYNNRLVLLYLPKTLSRILHVYL